jgi:hypothetical protein
LEPFEAAVGTFDLADQPTTTRPSTCLAGLKTPTLVKIPLLKALDRLTSVLAHIFPAITGNTPTCRVAGFYFASAIAAVGSTS